MKARHEPEIKSASYGSACSEPGIKTFFLIFENFKIILYRLLSDLDGCLIIVKKLVLISLMHGSLSILLITYGYEKDPVHIIPKRAEPYADRISLVTLRRDDIVFSAI